MSHHQRRTPRLPIDKYRPVPKQQENSKDNEIRVKAQGRHFYYAAYAGKLLFGNTPEIQILGTGKAIPKIIQVVEYLRKRMKGLHVSYSIQSVEFSDEYEPLEEGLERVIVKRLVGTLIAQVSLDGKNIKDKIGYMAPLPEKELLNQDQFKKDVEDYQFRKEEDKNDGQLVEGHNRDRRVQNRGQNRYPVQRGRFQRNYDDRERQYQGQHSQQERRPYDNKQKNFRYQREDRGGNGRFRNNRRNQDGGYERNDRGYQGTNRRGGYRGRREDQVIY